MKKNLPKWLIVSFFLLFLRCDNQTKTHTQNYTLIQTKTTKPNSIINIQNLTTMESTNTKVLEGKNFMVQSFVYEGVQLTYINYRGTDGTLKSELVLAGFEYVTIVK